MTTLLRAKSSRLLTRLRVLRNARRAHREASLPAFYATAARWTPARERRVDWRQVGIRSAPLSRATSISRASALPCSACHLLGRRIARECPIRANMMPLRQVGISALRGSGGVHVHFAEFGNRRDRR